MKYRFLVYYVAMMFLYGVACMVIPEADAANKTDTRDEEIKILKDEMSQLKETMKKMQKVIENQQAILQKLQAEQE